MNEDLLRQRLHGAVLHIEPANRLAEITAAPARRPRPPWAPRALIAAVVLAALLIGGALVLTGNGGDDDQVRLAPPTTTAPPPETTTTALGEFVTMRAGRRSTVSRDALPVGMEFLNETSDVDGDTITVVTRFAFPGDEWGGSGPYLRLVVERGVGARKRWLAERTDGPTIELGTGPAYEYRSRDGWQTVAWTLSSDEVIRVAGYGLDPQIVRALAQSMVPSP